VSGQLYRSTGRHRARRVPGPLRQFLRRAWAVAFTVNGVLALCIAFVAISLTPPLPSATAGLTTLGAALIGAGVWLSYPPGEAWLRLTGGPVCD
jgi:hypothetical protein